MYKNKYYKYLQKGGAVLTPDLVLDIFKYLPGKDIVKIVKNTKIIEQNTIKNNKYWNAVLILSDKELDEWKKKPLKTIKNIKIEDYPYGGDTDEISSVSWSNNDSNLICVSDNSIIIKVFNAESGKCLIELDGHTEEMKNIRDEIFQLALVNSENVDLMQLYDTYVSTLKGHSWSITSLCWSNDGSNRICSGSLDKNICIWDIHSGQCLSVLKGHNSYVRSVSWSNSVLNRICSGSNDMTIRIWDIELEKCLIVLKGHTDSVTSVCWSNDGSNRICSGSSDKTVRVWDAESGECLTVLEGHTRDVYSVCWSNDGSNRICSGSRDKTVRIWDIELEKCLTVLEGHTGWVMSVCWSNDGSNRICSGSQDSTMRVWDADSSSPNYGHCLSVLDEHTNWVTSVCWSSDGSNRICSAGQHPDKTVRIWGIK